MKKEKSVLFIKIIVGKITDIIENVRAIEHTQTKPITFKYHNPLQIFHGRCTAV
jgi:hypothetical protein